MIKKVSISVLVMAVMSVASNGYSAGIVKPPAEQHPAGEDHTRSGGTGGNPGGQPPQGTNGTGSK